MDCLMATDNSTLSTTQPMDGGYQNEANFEYYSTRAGNTKLVYKGIMFPPGQHSSAQRAAVKAWKNAIATEQNELWTPYRNAAEKARAYAKDYNKAFGTNVKIAFPGIAIMDSVAHIPMTIVRWLTRNKYPYKRLDENECVAIEPYISGKFETFVHNNGCGGTSKVDKLDAFCHYTFQQSKGNLVVCGLKGVRDFNAFDLTVPCIHSNDQMYGPEDNGEAGIVKFFEYHRCNVICRGLSTPKDNLEPEIFADIVARVTANHPPEDLTSHKSLELLSTAYMPVAEVHKNWNGLTAPDDATYNLRDLHWAEILPPSYEAVIKQPSPWSGVTGIREPQGSVNCACAKPSEI